MARFPSNFSAFAQHFFRRLYAYSGIGDSLAWIMDMVSAPGFWTVWQVAPQISVALLVIEYAYLRVMASATSTPMQRGYFLAGLGTIAFAVCTPFGAHAATLFWCHMIQHVTLMMISGPLLVLGTPANFHPSNAIFRTLTQPVLSWALYAAVMVGVHLPGPHQFIMNHSWVHSYLDVPLYVVVSYLFYFNLLDRRLEGRVISPAMSVISLFLMMVPETLTGFFIYIAPHSVYDGMFSLTDQRRGGSIMWSGGMIVDTIWMAFAVYHWIKSEELASKRVDLEIANEQ